MNSLYKITVFDLDGTLVNSLYDLGNSVNKGLAKAGLPAHPIDAYRRFVGDGREKLLERAMGKAYANPSKRETVRTVFDSEYRLHSNDNTADYPGCAQMLQKLASAGVLTAVLSNKPHEFVPEILKKVYPNHTFTEAWGQLPQYKCKPDGEALLAILAKHGLTQKDCLYIGDSNVDVFTAQNAGVDMIGVDWGFRGREELLSSGAPLVVSDPLEIYRIAVGNNE